MIAIAKKQIKKNWYTRKKIQRIYLSQQWFKGSFGGRCAGGYKEMQTQPVEALKNNIPGATGKLLTADNDSPRFPSERVGAQNKVR